MRLSRSLLPVLFAALLTVGASPAGAQAPAPQLASSSPFLPAGAAETGPSAAVASGPIELRGIMSTADGPRYCIYDTVRKTSTWVGLNEKGHDFTVKSQDKNAADSVTVFAQGRTLHLALRSAKVSSSLNVAPPVVAQNQGPLTQSVVVNPTPADEARRLEAVATEVQRRRQLREQALQLNTTVPPLPSGQPGTPPPMNGPPGLPRRQE